MEEDQLISVQEAEGIILKEKITVPVEEVNLKDSVGRILQENIHADNDFPPFNRVMMDGIAICHKAFEEGRKEFRIVGLQAAGTLQQRLINDSDCIEVMTGSMLPMYADTIVPYEDVKISNGKAVISSSNLNEGQHIHRQGNDHKREDKLLSKGKRITPAEVSVLATVGKFFVKVSGHPRIAIISTGDELVDVSETPAPHQIRRSNIYFVLAALKQENIDGDMYHLTDSKDDLRQKLKELIRQYDVLLLSGGVSKGKKDYLPEVFEELKVEKLFHRVAQRPGKPLWFGRNDETVIFGFPGNPVSTFLCFYRYFLPWYKASAQIEIKQQQAILKEDFTFKPELTCFLQVKLEYNEGKIFAVPSPGNGSGDLTNLTEADAFIELPAGKDSFTNGSVYPLIRYRF